jgi:hypothetical protein
MVTVLEVVAPGHDDGGISDTAEDNTGGGIERDGWGDQELLMVRLYIQLCKQQGGTLCFST